MTNERQRRIIKHIETRGFATIEELAKRFNVSAQTIRRDIIELDNRKLLQRFHGGAGVGRNTVRMGYDQKQITAIEGKLRIGEETSHLIHDDAYVYLDVGTTVEAVAQSLTGHQNLHVFTNSLAAANALAPSSTVEVYVIGGILRGIDGSLVGGDVESAISRLKFDFAVIACSGFSVNGEVMDFDIQKVGVKQAAMMNARHTILVADSSKFQRTAFVCISELGNFTHIITDKAPPKALKNELNDADVEIIVA